MASKYDNLVRNVRDAMASTLESLNKEREAVMSAQAWDVSSTLSWKAQDIAFHSELFSLLLSTARGIDSQTQDVLAEDGTLSDKNAEMVAKRIRVYVTHECLSIILRGPESSTSRASNMTSIARIDAARRAMKLIAGSYGFFDFDSEMISDMFDGMDRRTEEARAKAAATPSKVTYAKRDGAYVLTSYNRSGHVLESIGKPSINRKEAAKHEAAVWAAEIGVAPAYVVAE